MPSVLSHFIRQSLRLPRPGLTENNLADQTGRVFIVTGGYAGVGLELCKILYGRHGTVYVAGRSVDKANTAIAAIKSENPQSKGRIEFLLCDLGDLTTIKSTAETFLAKEARLDVLVNNAGVMFPPIGSTTAQGHELQIGTNCLGPYLLTRLLLPVLERTAALSKARSVRVLWAASFGVDALSPPKGVTLDAEGQFVAHASNEQTNYGASKAGNYYLASTFAKMQASPPSDTAVMHLAFNPGNLRTELQRHSVGWRVWIVDKLLLYPARFGAYTELWAGWTEEVSNQHNGAYVWPWGRFGGVRDDVRAQLESGGNAEKFHAWCKDQTNAFL